tara:strand:- start:39471 stop:40274 length:804 start_codon:yes stop_codon:yes gene_type:complete
MSLTDKKLKNAYGSLLNCSGDNQGISASLKKYITDGLGTNSCIELGQNYLGARPQNADSATFFCVKDLDGNNLLKVDTTNDKVLVGSSQINANTQIERFTCRQLTPVAGTHYAMHLGGQANESSDNLAQQSLGTTANPSTSITYTGSTLDYLQSMFYIPNNIVIDEVHYMLASAGTTTINLHLNSYSIVTGTGATSGNLADGTSHALSGSSTGSLSPIAVAANQISNGTLTIISDSISSGRVVLIAIENVGSTDEISGNVSIKYHIK